MWFTVVMLLWQVSADGQLPESVRFQSLHWQCKHFGMHKSRGRGKREVEESGVKRASWLKWAMEP